ncbi:MAG: ABC transporter ATP-binding protein [Nitrososphaeria archaeon]
MIETVSLWKVFRGRKYYVEALRDVTFRAERGKVTALVGPNGAGKTTLLRIVSTLVLPTSGRALVDGLDVVEQAKEVRRRIGLVTVSDRLLYYRLSGLENLIFYGALYDMSVSDARRRALELLELVGLGEWAEEPTMHYSSGMLRRLAIARALMHDPDVLLQDEPTIGIDVPSARKVRQLVRRLSEGRTVVLTSHLMGEIEELADYIYVLKEGRIIAKGTTSEITGLVGELAEARLEAGSVPHELERYIVRYENGYAVLRAPRSVIEEAWAEAVPVRPTLEDAYVILVGETGSDYRPHQFRRGGAWARERPV